MECNKITVIYDILALLAVEEVIVSGNKLFI